MLSTLFLCYRIAFSNLPAFFVVEFCSDPFCFSLPVFCLSCFLPFLFLPFLLFPFPVFCLSCFCLSCFCLFSFCLFSFCLFCFYLSCFCLSCFCLSCFCLFCSFPLKFSTFLQLQCQVQPFRNGKAYPLDHCIHILSRHIHIVKLCKDRSVEAHISGLFKLLLAL